MPRRCRVIDETDFKHRSFVGEYKYRVDDKNRILIPSDMRRIIRPEEGFIISSRNIDGYNVLVLTVSAAEDSRKMDKIGRLSLSGHITDKICASSHIAIVGAGLYSEIKIWNSSDREERYKNFNYQEAMKKISKYLR